MAYTLSNLVKRSEGPIYSLQQGFRLSLVCTRSDKGVEGAMLSRCVASVGTARRPSVVLPAVKSLHEPS